MRNFNFYKNEIEEIVKELPSNIKEWGVSEMLLHSAEGSYLRLNLNDGRDMFVLFYELLEEIYKNRSIELFLTGMRFEDSRRFHPNFAVPSAANTTNERNRNFYPYPSIERENNKNTPSDPSI